MNLSKMRFLLLGASVVSLGIMLGTLLWLKLAPTPGHLLWEQPLEGLNRYGTVPDFSLTERSGKRIALRDLRGKVWVADFIYTTCKDTCPLESAEMSKLQEEWSDKPDLKLVSFSVDPDHDTPQVLSSYAQNFKADANRWLFLTGEKEQISRLIQEGFRLSAAPVTESGSQDQVILHSPRLVLVDKETEIRGYYDSRDGEALARLKKDVLTLASGKKE
jgi:protein SCO1